MVSDLKTFSQSLARPGLSSDLRAFWAVVRREWTIFRRYPSWIISLFIWPMIFPMAYLLTARALSGVDGSGLAQFRVNTGMSDYIGYIAVGTTIWMWQNIVLWDVGFSLRNEQLRGTLESNWLSPTKRFSFLLGSTMPQLVSVVIFMVIAALEFTLFFGVRFQGSLWLTLLVFLTAIPAIYGLGFAFASIVITAREAHAFVFLVRGIVMIFCGITFPVTMLPGWMQSITYWLPQTYVIHAMRLAVLSPVTFSDLAPDLLALVLFGVFWLTLGYVMFSLMERRARQTGAIGQY
jgi:ABC-2 type transport system permease protein